MNINEHISLQKLIRYNNRDMNFPDDTESEQITEHLFDCNFCLDRLNGINYLRKNLGEVWNQVFPPVDYPVLEWINEAKKFIVKEALAPLEETERNLLDGTAEIIPLFVPATERRAGISSVRVESEEGQFIVLLYNSRKIDLSLFEVKIVDHILKFKSASDPGFTKATLFGPGYNTTNSNIIELPDRDGRYFFCFSFKLTPGSGQFLLLVY